MARNSRRPPINFHTCRGPTAEVGSVDDGGGSPVDDGGGSSIDDGGGSSIDNGGDGSGSGDSIVCVGVDGVAVCAVLNGCNAQNDCQCARRVEKE